MVSAVRQQERWESKVSGGSGDVEAFVNAVSEVIGVFGVKSDYFKNTKISITSEGFWTIYRYNQKMSRIKKTRLKIPEKGAPLEWVEAKQ